MMAPTESRQRAKLVEEYEWTSIVRKKREKFWTPAERAGLKAMGISLRTFRPMSEYPTFQEGLLAHRAIIRAYVKASRKSKAEGEKR